MMEASELIERLEKATAPDRNLDAALHVALVRPEQRADDLRYFRVPSANMDHMEMCAPGTYWLKERSGASLQTAPAYTASIDAALALVERVLPGWKRGFRDHDEVEGDGVCAWLCSPDYSVIHWSAGDVHKTDVTAGMRVTGDAPTFALALCLALLRAALLKAQPTVSPQAPAE